VLSSSSSDQQEWQQHLRCVVHACVDVASIRVSLQPVEEQLRTGNPDHHGWVGPSLQGSKQVEHVGLMWELPSSEELCQHVLPGCISQRWLVLPQQQQQQQQQQERWQHCVTGVHAYVGVASIFVFLPPVEELAAGR
jgi:hypothetical protein